MSFKIIATGFLVLMTFVETQIRAILTIFDSFLENTNRLRSAPRSHPERSPPNGIDFDGLPCKLSEASGNTGGLEKVSRTLSGPGETFYKGGCFSPSRRKQ